MPRAARFVTGRQDNVVRVDFRRDTDPPSPRFPGAAGQRIPRQDFDFFAQRGDLEIRKPFSKSLLAAQTAGSRAPITGPAR